MKLLFVCTGNMCRSPMAEALLRHELEGRDCEGFQVSSAGTWAAMGEPPTEEAILVCAGHGIDISSHRSKLLEPDDLEGADVVVGMTNVHRQEVASLAPDARHRTILLKEIAEVLMPTEWPDATAEERLRALLSAPRPKWRRKLDLADPIGRPMRVYERCFSELQEGVGTLADILCPEGLRP
jgi:protein-tyrosine-phosphatase